MTTETKPRTLERCDHIEPANSWSTGRRCLRLKGHQSAHRLVDDDMAALWEAFARMKEAADAANQIVAADWHEMKALRAASRASPEEGRALRDAHSNDIDCGCYGPGECKYAAALAALRSPPAPEAKTAESEVGWVMCHQYGDAPLRLRDALGGYIKPDAEGATLVESCRVMNAHYQHNPNHKYVPLRVRVSVEPAPVEPEETR